MTTKLMIYVTTYNEADNIVPLLDGIEALKLDGDILVVDDNSPDGTADLVAHMADTRPFLHLIRRPAKLGIGTAHLAALCFARERGYSTVLSMDADFSHSPEDIPRFLEASDLCGVVLGTRFESKESLSEWSVPRKAMTLLGHFLTRVLLRLPYDATGAFRVYRLDRIPHYCWDFIESRDYEFFFESLTIMHAAGVSIKQVPISLPARVYGHSKMRFTHICRGVLRLFALSLKLPSLRKRLRVAGSLGKHDPKETREQWDEYWSDKGADTATRIYSVAAEFYRDHLIKPILNRTIRSCFPPGSRLLHAGCGGGQVDVDVVNYAEVTALDISPLAVRRYQALHGQKAECLIGDIFKLGALDGKFGGVYNLGVMEHLGPEQIKQVLREFHGALNEGGRVVLFWPPVYGLSVVALHVIHFVLKRLLKRNIQLHPLEPTKVRSRKQVERWLRDCGFELERFSFGPRDAFTFVLVVARRMDINSKRSRSVDYEPAHDGEYVAL